VRFVCFKVGYWVRDALWCLFGGVLSALCECRFMVCLFLYLSGSGVFLFLVQVSLYLCFCAVRMEREMLNKKLVKIEIISLVSFVMILSLTQGILLTVKADSDNEGSLSSGYAVTSNYHGVNAPIGANVIVTAKTTDSKAAYVQFIWKDPAGHIIWQENVTLSRNGETYKGKAVYSAQSTHQPTIIGDWGVQAKFFTSNHNQCGYIVDTRLATRATSFNVVPELPIIGTAGAAVAMVFGLMLFKRKQSA
jgi:hypothetical protein